MKFLKACLSLLLFAPAPLLAAHPFMHANRHYDLREQASPEAKIASLKVFPQPQQDSTLVMGKLVSKNWSMPLQGGAVQLSLYDPDGKLLGTQQTVFTPSPLYKEGFGQFAASFPVAAPEGSQVVARYIPSNELASNEMISHDVQPTTVE